MTVKGAIPTIDIGPWLSADASQQAKDDVVKQVSLACSTYGFFNLVGHGIPVEAQKRAWEASKKFFDLPLDEKMEVSVDKSMGKAFRGYEPSLIQTHQEGLLPDTKEVRSFPQLWHLEMLMLASVLSPVLRYRRTTQMLVASLQVPICGQEASLTSNFELLSWNIAI